MSRVRGFTLLELLIVMAIVGILATIGLPLYVGHQAKAANAAAVSDLQNFKIMMDSTYSELHFYPPM